MLTVGLIILFCLSINKKATVFCVAPISIHFIYWELYCALPSIQNFQSTTFSKLIQDCYFRAMADMPFGVIAGAIFVYLSNKDCVVTRILRSHGTVFGSGGIMLALLLIRIQQQGLMEYICIVIFIFAVICLSAGAFVRKRKYTSFEILPCDRISRGVKFFNLYKPIYV